jgi:type I restriction enzyme M protein
LASINLPRNTFFNTSQATCILVIEKRHSEVDERPEVLCGYVRTIGESLDTYRAPEPDKNDLIDVANFFLERRKDATAAPKEDFIKVISKDEFSANDRWDVSRFWTEEEFVSLGVKPSAIGQDEFIDEAILEIGELANELKTSKAELQSLTKRTVKEVDLSDKTLFNVRSGTRVTNTQVLENSGEVPVYSCFKYKHTIKGKISESFLVKKGITIEDPKKTIITIAANGYVGTVFTRREKCMITDDLIAVEVLDSSIDPNYLAAELRRQIAAGGYSYEAKLFKGRVLQLKANIPIDSKGNFDLNAQVEMAAAQQRFDLIRDKLHELGKWGQTARVN